MKTLETTRLLLRKITSTDMNNIQKLVTDDDVTALLDWDTSPSQNDNQHFLATLLQKYTQSNVAWAILLKETDEFIGVIEFSDYRHEEKITDMHCVIAKQYWRNDYASEATQAIIRYGFSELQLERIQASYFAENIRSERVLQKAGLFYEGTQRHGKFTKGRYHDIKLYAILRSDLGY